MIEIKGVSKTYPDGCVALKDINLKFPDNGFFAIIGETGCGKSTLMNIIGTFEKPTSGEILIDNIPVSSFSAKMYDNYRCNYLSCIFQNISIFDLVPDLTVQENIDLSFFLQNRKIDEKKIVDLLELLKIKEVYGKESINLSGGQIQRSSTVRAIGRNTKIIIADEPTSSLDPKTKEIIVNLFKELSKKKLIIVISHDISILDKVDGVVILNDGRLVSYKSKEELEKNELFNKLINKNKNNDGSFFESLSNVDNDKVKDTNIEYEKKISNIINNINNEERKNNLRKLIPLKYTLRIIFNNIKTKPFGTLMQIVTHFFIFFLLTVLATLVLFALKKLLPEIKKNTTEEFEKNEVVSTAIYVAKVFFGTVASFAVFISSRSVNRVMKNNRQKIGVLRSIGTSSLSIFVIYFIETLIILSLSFLFSTSLYFLYSKSYVDFTDNIKTLGVMSIYLFVISAVSVLIPSLLLAKKSIISMLKKN